MQLIRKKIIFDIMHLNLWVRRQQTLSVICDLLSILSRDLLGILSLAFYKGWSQNLFSKRQFLAFKNVDFHINYPRRCLIYGVLKSEWFNYGIWFGWAFYISGVVQLWPLELKTQHTDVKNGICEIQFFDES